MKNIKSKNILIILSFVTAFVALFSASKAFALDAAPHNFYSGQTYHFAGHYRLVTERSKTYALTLNSGDIIVGAYAGYGSEIVGSQLPTSDRMTLTADGTSYYGNPTAQYTFTGIGDMFNTSGQLASGGLQNGIMQANDFSQSGLKNLGVGTYSISLSADSANVSGAGAGGYYTYFVIENDNLPLQEVVVNTFAIDDYQSSGATQDVYMPTEPGITPAIGQKVTINTQVTSPDLNDTMTFGIDGITADDAVSTSPSASVPTNASMQNNFAAGKLHAQITFHNSDITAPEVIQGFGATLPMTGIVMNYHLVDLAGDLLDYNGTFGGSFSSQEATSPAQAETITNGQLTLTGVLGDTFPTLSAPKVPDYTLSSGPTLNSGGSYTPTATNPFSTATYSYYKNAQHITQYVDQDGKALLAPTLTDGADGTTYQSTAPAIHGYSLEHTTGVTTGAYNHKIGNTTTVFQYTNIGTITLHFLDFETHQPIQATQVLKGIQLQNYNLVAPAITNHRFDPSISDALTGTYQAQNRDINLYYAQASSVTVNLVDKTTSTAKIIQSIPLSGYSGDAYTYNLPQLQDYQKPVTPSVTGNYTNAAQTIAVYYVKNTGTLTLNYLNAQTGLSLLPSERITSNIGDWQIIDIPNIGNYDFINTGNEVAFQQLLPNQTRSLYYDPNVDTVKVDYLDTKGNPIAPSQTIVGYYGSARTIKALPIKGYQIQAGTLSSYPVDFNQLYQHLIFRYQPQKCTVTFKFINDINQTVYQNKTITGSYNDSYTYNPEVPWFDSLTYASQKKITGKYNQPKTDITVHYTRRQASITVIDKDDWGKILETRTFTSYENYPYRIENPSYWNLTLQNPAQKVLTGIYRQPKATITVIYKHIPAYVHTTLDLDNRPIGVTTVNQGWLGYNYFFHIPNENDPYLTPYPGPNTISGYFNQTQIYRIINYYHITTSVTFYYIGTDGEPLGSAVVSGWYGTGFTYNVPASFGDYYIEGGTTYTGGFANYNQSVNVYYYYSPPVTASASEGSSGGENQSDSARPNSGRSGGAVVASRSGSSGSKVNDGEIYHGGSRHDKSNKNTLSKIANSIYSYITELPSKIYNYIKDNIVEGLSHYISEKASTKFFKKLATAIDLEEKIEKIFSGIDFWVAYNHNHNVGVSAMEVILDNLINNAIDGWSTPLAIDTGVEAVGVAMDLGLFTFALAIGGIAAGIIKVLAWGLKTIVDNLLNDFIDDLAEKVDEE
ncbi:MucBP domain-containing protein [Lactococcus kimchii]|uniref:MucBP domain-containing protein n=1 Tax=Lactococcus sp. S-13 TaxID=2507158 RepID=UPI0010236DBA|nr:MucBP domain-containing protein [Lactococcus sp. S-13]RZI49627.1 hypothetical protein EQJ87_09435 [Lactococcus sp. S-13]